MKSMTGYGRASAALGNATLTVQVSSVNRKTLDLTISAPSGWDVLETAVTELVRKFAVRGKVHVAIELTGEAGNNALAWDEAAVRDVLVRLARLADTHGHPFQPTPELLWQVAVTHRSNRAGPDPETAREPVLETIEQALRAFSAMRAKEGETLLIDFLKRLALLSRCVAAVAERAPEAPAYYREQLLKRLREAGLDLDVNDERVLKEIALFADRCDITEELTRLQSHLAQFEALLKSDVEIGRKAEFILQEIGREVHTIGSKANDLAISRQVIELKNELERIREQIANVE